MQNVKLYHFTSREAAVAILAKGFTIERDDGVWFTPHPQTAMGEESRVVLLEVEIDRTDDEMSEFRQPVVEEFFDDETEEWVPDPSTAYDWFKVPAAKCQQLISSIRVVQADERRDLMI